MRCFSNLFLAASFACIGTIANAHPLPKSASPKPNAVLATSPTEVRMGFSEGLVAAFSGIEVDDQSAKPVDTGDATVNPNDNKELTVPIKAKLVPGTYTVKWHAVGDDTHHVSGHYSFQVQP
jgi:hypothetical protein